MAGSDSGGWPQVLSHLSGRRSKTPLEGYSVFLSYEISTCETEIKHPRVSFPNARRLAEEGRAGAKGSPSPRYLFRVPRLSYFKHALILRQSKRNVLICSHFVVLITL